MAEERLAKVEGILEEVRSRLNHLESRIENPLPRLSLLIVHCYLPIVAGLDYAVAVLHQPGVGFRYIHP